MAARIWEKPKSQSGEVPFFGQTSQREFAACDCADESALIALVLASPTIVPAINTVNGNPLFIEKYSYKEFAGGNWDVTAHYSGFVDQKRLSIDTSGGTRKKFFSDATVGTFSCDLATSPPDFERAIGVTQNGVDGVDVIDPRFEFSINQQVKLSLLSASYLQTLKKLTGKVNDSLYAVTYAGQVIEFDTEELLFKGVTLNQTAPDDGDLVFKFAGQDSVLEEDGQTIGLSAAISKQGWQYLWVYYAEVNDAASARLIRKPISAYVERVFKLADFDQLGLF